MEEIIELIRNVGFPIAVAVILLVDKIKTNGKLGKIVENNNEILKEIKNKIK